MRPDEDLDQAAARELAEETGLRTGSWHLEQLASYGTPDRDPRMRVVTVAYWAICAELPGLRGGGDAADALLMPVKKIESGSVRLAFDHERIVRDAVERTRSKLEYTALAAKFCRRSSRSDNFAASTRRSGTPASTRETSSATFRRAARSRNEPMRRRRLVCSAGGRRRCGPSAMRTFSIRRSGRHWSGPRHGGCEPGEAKPARKRPRVVRVMTRLLGR